MRCLYCHSQITKLNIESIFLEEDVLCVDCRNKLKINKKMVDLKNIKVNTLYSYDEGLFRDLLIQYKECFDEALAPVFLYLLKDYIRFKYFGYKILFVPSSKRKIAERGFNHLEKIFEDVKMPKIRAVTMKQELIQEGMSLAQRKRMINNYIYEGDNIDKVLIVDDVLTSGSSVLGVYNAIKPYAKKISVLTLARKENAFIKQDKCDKI